MCLENEISGHSDGQHIANELAFWWDLSQRAGGHEAMRTAPGFDGHVSVVGKAVRSIVMPLHLQTERKIAGEININQGKPMLSKPISVVDE